jgi:hypothetical protein
MAAMVTPTAAPAREAAKRCELDAARVKPAPKPMIAIMSEIMVMIGSNVTGALGSYARIATKCVHQTEQAPTEAVCSSQPIRCSPSVLRARSSSLTVTRLPTIQTTVESRTSHRLCSVTMQVMTRMTILIYGSLSKYRACAKIALAQPLCL